jgi:hypothetical protein
MFVEKLFPYSKIMVRNSYSGCSEKCDAKKLVEEGSLVPLEASSVLEKLYMGDLKSFADIYIDAMLCTEITALCRENGPRIKYGVAQAQDGVEVYSECFDPELLFNILLGDIAKALMVYTGYRDNIKFKLIKISKEITTREFLEIVENRILNSANHSHEYLKEEPIGEFLKKLVQEKSFSEIILQVPCLDKNFIHVFLEIVKKIRESGKIVYIATSIPTKENARFCKVPYKDFVAYYIQLIEESKMHKIIICDSEAPHIGIIVDRRIYMMSSDIIYREDLHVIPIADTKYANDYATLVLKHCLCSNNLIKDDSKVIQKDIVMHMI